MISFLTRNIYEGYQLIDSLKRSVLSKPHSTFLLEKFETTSDLSREFLFRNGYFLHYNFDKRIYDIYDGATR